MNVSTRLLSATVLFSFLSAAGYPRLTDHQFIFNRKIRLSHSEIDERYVRFTPTPQEIQLVDSLGKIYIKNNRKKYPWADEITQYNSYYRQYVGYLNLNNQKTIFVNGFCKPQSNWQTKLVQVPRGGS